MDRFTRIVCWFALVGLCHSQGDHGQAWAALNDSIGGRLQLAKPIALPCFSLYNGDSGAAAPDEALCAQVRGNYTANAFRADQPAAYMQLQDEMCLSDPADQCVLDGSVVPAGLPPAGSSCNQGSVPSFYVEVQGAEDVKAAFAFAEAYDVPIAIKNGGHDYLTRSSQKGGLGLWVHKLQGLVYHQSFVPEGCPAEASVGPALALGAGVNGQRALEFASQNKATFVTGYSPTIAVSGGWVQGGGHSVLSPAFGMGVDRVAEFKVVTPDGAIRVANACQNEDLFWALRGGGGGTFGVVLEATHRVEPAGPVAIANITLPSNATAETSLQWIELAARQSLKWGRQGWGGHIAGRYLTYMNPLLADVETAREAMQPSTDFALALGGSSTVEIEPDYLALWNKFVLPGALKTSGQPRLLASRLIPRRFFENEEGIAKIMGFLVDLQNLGFDPTRFYAPVGSPFVAAAAAAGSSYGGGSSGKRQQGDETSVTPAWYSSLWSIGNGVSFPWNATYTERLKAVAMAQEATRLGEALTGTGQDGGAYVNEVSPFTENWRESWWGGNYPRLLEIKKKYDPKGLLKCWKCIGFEENDVAQDRFRCLGKIQQELES